MSKNRAILLILFLFVFDVFVWEQIIFNAPKRDRSDLYFLNVGQGDSELVILEGNIKILIDGGPSGKIISELEKIIKPIDRYLDLVILTHPQTDHFTGLIDVLKRYQVGAFIYNGLDSDSASFKELKNIIEKRNVSKIVLAEGDKIKHLQDEFIVLSPNKNILQDSNINDTCLVLQLISQKTKALFTGDLEGKVEKELVNKYGDNLRSDILKVPHHGSKYSSTDTFLQVIKPKISVIEVGKNSYGHPASETLNRLANIGSQIFNTYKNDTIKIILKEGKAYVFTQ